VSVIYSTTYSGDHGFEVSVQKQPKETKSATWTVGNILYDAPHFFSIVYSSVCRLLKKVSY